LILVVEDQAAMRALICEMLEGNRFAVLEAGSAVQALELLQVRTGVALAIVDMIMPGMSGLDLAAELDRRHPGTPILYISGLTSSIAMQAIADRSPESVLFKPFTEQRLIGRVRRLLGLAERSEEDEERVLDLENAWERLIEGSDRVPDAGRVAAYRNTAAAYSIAAAHSAILRQANLPYQFRHLDENDHAFELLVPAVQRQRARDCISLIGLGADIQVAA
jgi:CheY-like chemotaxis protein